MERKCNKCLTIKPLENFYKSKERVLGHEYVCKMCSRNRKSRKTSIEEYDAKRESVEKIGKYLYKRTINALNSYKKSDSKKNYQNNLTFDFVLKVLNEQNCVYCGYPSTGLDRIDNSKGHTIGNCVPCCRICNISRMDNFSHDEMKELGEVISLIKLKRGELTYN